jgi:hypothetical protein
MLGRPVLCTALWVNADESTVNMLGRRRGLPLMHSFIASQGFTLSPTYMMPAETQTNPLSAVLITTR